ncbi:unnamed protein product [Thlaspi arvense]|uniref:Protein FAR1-RELATED SEQUENCE n=1 Tax=Thlaspi arvense TaxID=13288 RepID=A0AAU9SP27_THLAR|nr:unnamed protein product [Thlaspi arvense]
MIGSSVYSPPDESLSPNPNNLCITIEEGSPSSEQVVVQDGDNAHLQIDCDGLLDEIAAESKCPVTPPVTGMEFDSYDDAYSFYNSYARELGFAIRVKSSWTKRNSKEKRGAVLCCNCEGFKMVKDANSRRKETRTGCQAMVRLRLIELDRWKVDEVKLLHNHSFDPERAHNSKSHKNGPTKRKPEPPPLDVQVRTIKLYRALAPIDTPNSSAETSDPSHDHSHSSRRLDLRGVSEVFPRAHHRLSLTHVLQTISQSVAGLHDSESFRMALNRVVYGFLKVQDFEMAWEEMIIRFGLTNHETIKALFQDRQQWAPVYLKDTFLALALSFPLGNASAPFIFSDYVHQHTSLREFLEEREGEKVRDFEVMYETGASAEVRCFCACGGFSFNGYQCRHVLALLSHMGLEEVPSQYILQRWRKDVNRLYVADFGSGRVDIMNPAQWYEHLHRRAIQVVEQGMRSKEHCRVALEAFKESVNNVRLVTEKPS